MKLKKIVSLALAGVLAVSMLAGCSNGSSNNNNSSSSEQTAVTGAAAALNAVQKVVEFKDGTVTAPMLATAAKAADFDQLEAATLTATPADSSSDKVAGELKTNVMQGKYTFSDDIDEFATNTNAADAGKSKTVLYLYLIDDVISEESALNVVGQQLTAANFPASVTKSTDSYAATYTGEASIAKVSKTDENGKTVSAYYVLLAVTQSVAEDKTVSGT